MKELFWSIEIAAWIFMVIQAVRLRLPAQYPLIYTYITLKVVFAVAMPMLYGFLSGTNILYTYIYVGASALCFALRNLIFLKIYWLFERPSMRHDWYLLLGPVAAIAYVSFTDNDVFQFVNVTYILDAYVGVACLIRVIHRRFYRRLGWNLRIVLFALTAASIFQSIIVAASRLSLGGPANLWLQGVGTATWIILAVGLSDFSPPE